MKMLKEFQTFSVFCAFIDPRTDTYIEASLPFFPTPQPAYPGRYFLSEYKGLAVKISCDFDWFATKQMDGVKRATVPYETSVISSGAYKQVSIKLWKLALPSELHLTHHQRVWLEILFTILKPKSNFYYKINELAH